jgi:hypothetical protein
MSRADDPQPSYSARREEIAAVAVAASSKALSMDNAIATSSADADQVEAGIVYSAGRSYRARAQCPCIVEMS